MQIACIKYGITAAGRDVPFDRVYIAQHADRKVLRGLFPYALVMPITEDIRKAMLEATPQRVLHFGNRDRVGVVKSMTQPEYESILTSNEWVLVVPILTKFVKQNMPRYLLNARWANARTSKHDYRHKDILPALAFLQTPEQIIRPVCAACPRFFEHQAGKCRVGSYVCFESLALGGVDSVGMDNGAAPAPEDVRELLDQTDATEAE